ncbi:hypothetical protein UFOVP1119_12 [uncultured Caudovirales phage]|jgi:hypothetical protein|uniref:Uncharacterized protein n=1 Tax=uncultured Caudovirales phage TaxID=2100421 RepID=A0A6J5QRU5_9CAUD|nr:hypothetical protein UFOVP1119_12 [uncultured Caudovirales phage]CAB4193711.1 hypothetical protein UFOVP1238_129 [uncultured Caudovirales phage]
MDNNQQTKDGGTTQPASATPATQAVDTGAKVAPAVSDQGTGKPGTINTGTPFTGKDVSMTTPQYAGGPIATTEAGSAR